MTDEIPPMEPLAPIIDQMREIAADELPDPQTCRIRLWDDGTFDAYIFHSMAGDESQVVRYDRTTSEILLEHHKGAGTKEIPLSGGETIIEPTFEESTIRVITNVEPPYKDSE